jgi:hypothetical protein
MMDNHLDLSLDPMNWVRYIYGMFIQFIDNFIVVVMAFNIQ